MTRSSYGKILVALVALASGSAQGFTLAISGEGGDVGQKVESGDCQIGDEAAFTTNAGNTIFTDEESYSGDRAMKMTIEKGSKGFGTWGGTFRFENCAQFGGRKLVKGDEVWVRARILVPDEFEFYQQGRNKFFRLRTYHNEGGKAVSDGYNDLYINGSAKGDFSPYHFIFEGAQRWYKIGSAADFFQPGQWTTIEFYLKLDDKKQSEGGDSRVRVWVDGELIGDTGERATLKLPDSYAQFFNLFTWWGNKGAHKTQSLYVDDFVISTDQPASRDAHGHSFIGEARAD